MLSAGGEGEEGVGFVVLLAGLSVSLTSGFWFHVECQSQLRLHLSFYFDKHTKLPLDKFVP